MPKKRYIVTLTPDEREALQRLTRQGQVGARKMKRAQILLKADQGATDPEIMAALDVAGSASSGYARGLWKAA